MSREEPGASPLSIPLAVRAESECVHCGFCLPACPTYEALGTEMDSPRGRLHLMRALEEGRIGPSEPVVRHLDLCLGCRACETECPSGVPFGHRLEAAREKLRASPHRPAGVRALESMILNGVAAPAWTQRAGLGALSLLRTIGLTRLAGGPVGQALLPASLVAGARLVDSAAPGASGRPLSRVTPAEGVRRWRVGLLEGCVSRWMFGSVNEATVRLLAAAGCEVVVADGQGCCGALHAHSGDRQGARALARVNVAAFEAAGPFDAIVVNAAGCGSTMKDYGRLLAASPGEPDSDMPRRATEFSARVRDALEWLAEIGPPAPVREVRARVAYHDACHLAHAQAVRAQPRELLGRVPGLQLVPLADSDRCCGSAGIYNLLHPEEGALILEPKLRRLRESGADVVAAANPGCLMHIAAGARRAGLPLRVAHPLELLDEACREKPA